MCMCCICSFFFVLFFQLVLTQRRCNPFGRASYSSALFLFLCIIFIISSPSPSSSPYLSFFLISSFSLPFSVYLWLCFRYAEEFPLPKVIREVIGQETVLFGDAVISTIDTCFGTELCEELFTPDRYSRDVIKRTGEEDEVCAYYMKSFMMKSAPLPSSLHTHIHTYTHTHIPTHTHSLTLFSLTHFFLFFFLCTISP